MIATTLDTIIPTITTRLEPQRLPAPGRSQFVATVDIPPGVHIQSHDPTEPFLIPTRLNLDPTADITFAPVEYPTPDAQRFDWTPVQLAVYRGTVQFVVPITIAPTREDGAITITGYLRYQACTDSLCLPPTQLQVEATLNIEPQRISDAT